MLFFLYFCVILLHSTLYVLHLFDIVATVSVFFFLRRFVDAEGYISLKKIIDLDWFAVWMKQKFPFIDSIEFEYCNQLEKL